MTEDKKARIAFVELPARNLSAAKAFYEAVFGWSLTDFGPSYACTMTADVDLGLQGDMDEAPTAPLPVVRVDDLEAARAAVLHAGGVVVQPNLRLPGRAPLPLHRSWRDGAGGHAGGRSRSSLGAVEGLGHRLPLAVPELLKHSGEASGERDPQVRAEFQGVVA
jgi:predicted enzyme related to lactoylglutathione lyase